MPHEIIPKLFFFAGSKPMRRVTLCRQRRGAIAIGHGVSWATSNPRTEFQSECQQSPPKHVYMIIIWIGMYTYSPVQEFLPKCPFQICHKWAFPNISKSRISAYYLPNRERNCLWIPPSGNTNPTLQITLEIHHVFAAPSWNIVELRVVCTLKRRWDTYSSFWHGK